MEDLRVEWAKSLSRAERWEEELWLLKAEMVRTLRFFEYKSAAWFAMAGERTGVPPDIRAGLFGYAYKQSSMYHQIAKRFAGHWIELFRTNSQKLPFKWPEAYREVVLPRTQVKRRPQRQLANIRLQRDRDEAEEMEIDM
ncbi:hypothetical protein SCHPADRAFT_947997 [Schizopora paradoxa]|uniref:Uncharacterized protein n=1 Tax=Schizopora paradoxa TaxID=27342 RepID=A0A0H2QWZ1_9AGAM|nr:hypothetical protein SCHPADRAFT_947997 [Schizopora paradoxa]